MRRIRETSRSGMACLIGFVRRRMGLLRCGALPLSVLSSCGEGISILGSVSMRESVNDASLANDQIFR